MNILVIGGSGFLGKHFVNMAYEMHHLIVFNQGKKPLHISGVEEIVGDRNKPDDLEQLKNYNIDVVIDTCGFMNGQVEKVFQVLGNSVKQYIFISSVDVYEFKNNVLSDETAPVVGNEKTGDSGRIKTALEKELFKCSSEYGVPYTTFRPACIYGPGNYPIREQYYFRLIKEKGFIPYHPLADGEFQMVFVKDIAKAMLRSIGNPDTYHQAYNMTGDRILTFPILEDTLERVVPRSFEKKLDKNGALMWNFGVSLRKMHSDLYNGEKVLTLIGAYTDFEEGMKEEVSVYPW